MNDISLEARYNAEVDKVNTNEWHNIIRLFDDANLYQSWSYEDAMSRGLELSHLVLKEGDDVLAAAEVCVMSVPILKSGIAYVRWGPLWRRKGRREDLGILIHALAALRAEYVYRRHLLLRVFPLLFDDTKDVYLPIFEIAGFRRVRLERSQRTLLVDLTPSIEDLKRGCRRTWRQKVGYAVKHGLEIVEGTSTGLIEDAIRVYDQMHRRKRFFGVVRMKRYVEVQGRLPNDMQLSTMICKYNGEPSAAMVWASIGEMGLPVLAATSNKGLANFSSYLLWWKMLEALKGKGKRLLNVGGINPERNPGGYIFKKGFSGKNGKDVCMLGKFDAFMLGHPVSVLSLSIVRVRDLIALIRERVAYFVWQATQRKKMNNEVNKGSESET